jgi:hypothetical protein
MDSARSAAIDHLRQLLSRRGWAISSLGESLTAQKHEWPAQLSMVIDPGSAHTPSTLGLLVDFRSMPLRGERFRDIFNNDREDLLRGMGTFRARQMRPDQTWTEGVADRAFLRGVKGGVSRTADAVLFDRCPTQRAEDLVAHFHHESTRLLETASEIASLLRRTYNRTVLRGEVLVSDLPDMVTPRGAVMSTAPTPAVVGESYPWRR